MTAKLNLRREKPYLVPCPTAYLSGRSSIFSQKSELRPVARVFHRFLHKAPNLWRRSVDIQATLSHARGICSPFCRPDLLR